MLRLILVLLSRLVFELEAQAGRTDDRRTDGRTGKTCNVAYRDGLIIKLFNIAVQWRDVCE